MEMLEIICDISCFSFQSLKPCTLEFHNNKTYLCAKGPCVSQWLLDLNMSAVNLARLCSHALQQICSPISFPSSSHADSPSLRGSGRKQLGGSHVPGTLLMCASRARLAVASRDLGYRCVRLLDVSAGSLYSFEK